MKQIITQLFYEMEKQEDTVIVSLIADRGSAPRGTGSQMLVAAGGRLVGTIGGGAVEKRSEEMAQEVLREKKSRVHEFVLRTNPGEDIGMVCGGDVTVHFQYVGASDAVWADVAKKAAAQFESRSGGWLVLREDGGAPALVSADHAILDGGGLVSEAPEALWGSGCVRREGYFSIPLAVGKRAILFGAGHISQALCPLLKSVDFRPVVFDCRAEYADAALFPAAEEVICGDFQRLNDYLTIDENDYLVVMTNGHSHDFEVEEQVLRGDFAYLGVIGSRSKTASVNARLRERGISDEAIARVHTPVGTKIKAVTPEEIAVSIAGEMIYVRALARENGSEQHRCPMQ